MKKTLVILLTVFCILSIVSCGSSDKGKESTKAPDNTTDATTDASTDGPSNPPAAATVGDTVQKTNFKFKLLDAKVYEQIGFQTAPAGKKFLVLFFEVENISSASATLAVTNFGASIKMLASKVDNYDTLNGGVAAGSKKQGYVAFEIGSNFNKLEVAYKDGYLSNNSYAYDNYSFIVKPENISNYNG